MSKPESDNSSQSGLSRFPSFNFKLPNNRRFRNDLDTLNECPMTKGISIPSPSSPKLGKKQPNSSRTRGRKWRSPRDGSDLVSQSVVEEKGKRKLSIEELINECNRHDTNNVVAIKRMKGIWKDSKEVQAVLMNSYKESTESFERRAFIDLEVEESSYNYKEKLVSEAVYRDYLMMLTPQEQRICEVEATSECGEAFLINEYMLFLTFGDCHCVYPCTWLSNTFVDLYLYNMLLENPNPKPKKLILPQALQLRSLDYIYAKERPTSLKTLCDFIVSSFIPEDCNAIEMVYIPLVASGHWFLVILDIPLKKCWIVDSLRGCLSDDMAEKVATEWLLDGVVAYHDNVFLRKLFEDATLQY